MKFNLLKFWCLTIVLLFLIISFNYLQAQEKPTANLIVNTAPLTVTTTAKDFSLYHFTVKADNRYYTVLLTPQNGSVKLFASRYLTKLDQVQKVINWSCAGTACATSFSSQAQPAITFLSPNHEADYQSWLAVYAETAATYELKVVSALAPEIPIFWQVLPDSTNCSLTDQNNTSWFDQNFATTTWSTVTLPQQLLCQRCEKYYRGIFYQTKKSGQYYLTFSSDDGLEIYLNGQKIGNWGGFCRQDGCVNLKGCQTRQETAPVIVTDLIKEGINHLTVHYSQNIGQSHLDLKLFK